MYQAVHAGHKHDLRFVTLTEDERKCIVHLLQDDIPFSKILDKIRSGFAGPELERLHLLERADLKNICRDFGLQKASSHQNDAASVRIWVEKERASASHDGIECSVRFVKFQGEEDSEWGLDVDDFVLVIMTDVQRVMLEKFGVGRVVCLDSTHGTNQYDFQLTTLMVIDDHAEGFPVAFCYSNHVDLTAMKVFLHAVGSNTTGDLSTVTLMTDDADVFASAWNSVLELHNTG